MNGGGSEITGSRYSRLNLGRKPEVSERPGFQKMQSPSAQLLWSGATQRQTVDKERRGGCRKGPKPEMCGSKAAKNAQIDPLRSGTPGCSHTSKPSARETQRFFPRKARGSVTGSSQRALCSSDHVKCTPDDLAWCVAGVTAHIFFKWDFSSAEGGCERLILPHLARLICRIRRFDYPIVSQSLTIPRHPQGLTGTSCAATDRREAPGLACEVWKHDCECQAHRAG